MCSHKMYSEALVSHYKTPLNKGRLADETIYESGYNPKCGDVIHLSIKISKDGSIEKIRFESQGCMICQASASILTVHAEQTKISEARQLIGEVINLFTRNPQDTDFQSLHPDIQALSTIRQYPTRTQCVTLAWHTLERALNRSSQL